MSSCTAVYDDQVRIMLKSRRRKFKMWGGYMLRFFRGALPPLSNVSKIPKRYVTGQSMSDSFEQYCIGKRSVDNFRKATKCFLRAQECFEKHDLVNAKYAIEEAIQRGQRVSALVPKSFLLHFQTLENKIDLSVAGQENKVLKIC
jgi:hypothetical protein